MARFASTVIFYNKQPCRPASSEEHAQIKEKVREHLRKSAFISDERAKTAAKKRAVRSDR